MFIIIQMEIIRELNYKKNNSKRSNKIVAINKYKLKSLSFNYSYIESIKF